jgi:serine protease Do
VGASVFALANPGGRGLRVTLGTVAAVGRTFRGPRGRRVTGTVEHTAPMAKGSSGGPLVDGSGRLVGLNTNRLGEGFYAALPADEELRRRVDALGRGESPARPHLGVGLVPGRAARHIRRAAGLPDRDGVLIQEVEDGSPAARAGLRRGDLIVEAGGSAVTTIDDLYQAVDGLDLDQALALEVVRGAEELSVSVTFGAGGTREEGSA